MAFPNTPALGIAGGLGMGVAPAYAPQAPLSVSHKNAAIVKAVQALLTNQAGTMEAGLAERIALAYNLLKDIT